MRKLFKILAYTFGLLLLIILALFAYLQWGLAPQLPEVKDKSVLNVEREKAGDNFYRIGNNWLRKTESGLWEEYVEGEPFERGVISGKLAKELLYSQELAFVEQIHRLIPDKTYLRFLSLFTRIFNRHLDENFPEENKLEIYGESFSAPAEFNYISPAYDRILNYHAAHDIGHALQSLALVGCSSFAVWDERSADSTMIIGRNLDFYMGDKFAQDKIVYFCNPTQGNKFVMITWAGFMGCVSGMNEKGVTVTINAAKSDVPTASATPISILAREILQYAGTIEEAFAIAKKRKTFVCETLMIGSAADKQTALIEKSVSKTVLFTSNTNFIFCTNHYQSDSFKTDKKNMENIATSSSNYRLLRLKELLGKQDKVNYTDVAEILRNQKGWNGKDIGMGNEKALNQLIAHHAVIFQPEKLRFWVSANPYQLGEFVCYDLKKVFAAAQTITANHSLHDTAFTIPADSFLLSEQWSHFLSWRELKQVFKLAIDKKQPLSDDNTKAVEFIRFNPEYWETYQLLGAYYQSRNEKAVAAKYYETALTKEIHDTREADKIRETINELR